MTLAAGHRDIAEATTASANGAGALGDLLPVVKLPAFVDRTDECASVPHVGKPERAALVRGGLLVVGGLGGSAKTTLTIDAVAHFASGTCWHGFELARPLRVLLIEVEGPREPLRQKLERKIAVWPGEPFAENVLILDGPDWGRFSFADRDDRRRLRNTCTKLETDLVVCNPVGRLGMRGGGTPEEVGEFVEWLRECGCWTDVAFWLIHHFNRGLHRDVLLRLSGAWDRDADTIIGLANEGQHKTKLTWAKFRWALDGGPEDAHVILAWDIATMSFHQLEAAAKPSRDEVRNRVRDWLATQPDWHSTSSVRENVAGSNEAIDEALRDLFESGEIELSVAAPGKPLQPVAEEQWGVWRRLRTPKYWKAHNQAEYQSPHLFSATDGDHLAPTPEEVPVAESPTPLEGEALDGDRRPGSNGEGGAADPPAVDLWAPNTPRASDDDDEEPEPWPLDEEPEP